MFKKEALFILISFIALFALALMAALVGPMVLELLK